MIDENEIPENINMDSEEPNLLANKDLNIKKEEDNPDKVENIDDLHEIKAADDIAEPDPETNDLIPLNDADNSATDSPPSDSQQ